MTNYRYFCSEAKSIIGSASTVYQNRGRVNSGSGLLLSIQHFKQFAITDFYHASRHKPYQLIQCFLDINREFCHMSPCVQGCTYEGNSGNKYPGPQCGDPPLKCLGFCLFLAEIQKCCVIKKYCDRPFILQKRHVGQLEDVIWASAILHSTSYVRSFSVVSTFKSWENS